MIVPLDKIQDLEDSEEQRFRLGWDEPDAFVSGHMSFHPPKVCFTDDLHYFHARVSKQPDFLWTKDSINYLALILFDELSVITDRFVYVLNPTLKSALGIVKKARSLSSSELIALNSFIGAASIKNEFDIEEFYTSEDEMSK